MSGEREHLRSTFDEVAELYEQARPGYPQPLADDLVELAGAGPGTSVLEIGCGTGQLTRLLAPRVGSVLCVELGAALAAVARRTLAGPPECRRRHCGFRGLGAGGIAVRPGRRRDCLALDRP